MIDHTSDEYGDEEAENPNADSGSHRQHEFGGNPGTKRADHGASFSPRLLRLGAPPYLPTRSQRFAEFSDGFLCQFQSAINLVCRNFGNDEAAAARADRVILIGRDIRLVFRHFAFIVGFDCSFPRSAPIKPVRAFQRQQTTPLREQEGSVAVVSCQRRPDRVWTTIVGAYEGSGSPHRPTWTQHTKPRAVCLASGKESSHCLLH
jgi:hypothetical protein